MEPSRAPKLLETLESQLDRKDRQGPSLAPAPVQRPVASAMPPPTVSMLPGMQMPAGPIPGATRAIHQMVCYHWLSGACKKGENCEYLHTNDIDKMPYQFAPPYGGVERGMYRHMDMMHRERCPFYDKGFCRNGPNCKLRHEQRQICPNYVYGFCPEGPDCQFFHPQSPISDEDDYLERLAWLIDLRKMWPYPYIPVWYIDRVCHKCGETGHSYRECPYAHLEGTKK